MLKKTTIIEHMEKRIVKNSSPLTARGIAIGLVGLLIITASSMYVALRMGALPWPTVFVTVLSMAALSKAKGSTLQEINCTHTLMSAGAMVAGGLAFTLPGLWMTDPGANLSIMTIIVIAVTGAILGNLFTALYRPVFIEEEKLPYPMGKASYDTLIAGKEGKGAPLLFSTMGASVIFTTLRDWFGWIPSVLTVFKGSALFPALSIWVSPMALGIGAIIGPVLALMWLLGSVIGYYIITPIGLKTGLFASMAEADIFRSNLGLGIMIGTGLGVAIMAIVKGIKKRNTNKGKRDINKNTLIAILGVCLMSTIVLAIFTEITFIEAIILVLGTYLAAYLSGMLTGQTGINPMEVFAILVLLFIAAIFKPSLIASFSIAGVVAVACGLTGDVMNDLKSGSLVGTPVKSQLIAEAIGGIVGAVVAAISLVVMKNAFGTFGTAELPAPQAASVAAMAGGITNKTAFFIGLVIGIVLYLLKTPSATLGLGFYLPNNISSIMALGAVTMAIVKKFTKDKAKAENNVNLISSGMLGGEGITGVIIAIISMF